MVPFCSIRVRATAEAEGPAPEIDRLVEVRGKWGRTISVLGPEVHRLGGFRGKLGKVDMNPLVAKLKGNGVDGFVDLDLREMLMRNAISECVLSIAESNLEMVTSVEHSHEMRSKVGF